MAATEMISISQFKATCLAVLERVRRTGQPILVTKRGKPIALIDPPPPPSPKKSWLGAFKDQGEIVGDILSPVLPASDWDALNE